MVLAMPWTSDIDANAMKLTKALVWVDLPMLNPTFEHFANQMLVKIGTVLYAQTAHARSKFSYIQGCVLCKLNEDLVEYIEMTIPNVGSYRVNVIYRSIPDAYFACKQRGHIARYCTNKPGMEKGQATHQTTSNQGGQNESCFRF